MGTGLRIRVPVGTDVGEGVSVEDSVGVRARVGAGVSDGSSPQAATASMMDAVNARASSLTCPSPFPRPEWAGLDSPSTHSSRQSVCASVYPRPLPMPSPIHGASELHRNSPFN